MGNRPTKVITTSWDSNNRNNMEDNRKDTITGLEELATQGRNLQSQLDSLVIGSGNSNAEVTQARVDKNGVTYTTLDARLEAWETKNETNTSRIGDPSTFETEGTSLSEKTRNEFNQRAFNLKRWESLKVAISGGYDWAPAIQAAIKYVMERGGGCILVSDGDYWGVGDIYTHPSNLDPAFKNSPLTIKGVTPVNADLFNTVKKVPRFIKRQTGSFLGVNYNETVEAVLTGTGVYRNFTIKNIAFFGGGTYDTKYTKVMNSVMNVKGIEKHNSAINIEDCNFWAMDWGVYDPEKVNAVDNYCDQSTYRRLGFSNMGTGWIQAYRSDASVFEGIYGYDMATTCKYGIRAKKGESFNINGILCAGKAMHLAKDFKLVSLEYCIGARVTDMYIERIEGLGIWLDSCINVTITEFDARHYSGVFGRGVNNRNVLIDSAYSHLEENKQLSPNDPGDYTLYDTITPPLNWDFDSTNIDVRYGREFYRNGVHTGGQFTETTARLTGRRNTTSKAVYQVGQQYIFDVIHNGTKFVVSTPAGQVEFGTLFASSLPTFNSATGEMTFPTDGAFTNISAAHISGRRSGTGVINNAYKISSNPLVVRLYNLSGAIITNAADVAFSVTLHI
jgi:hypothetical protein